MEAGIVPYTVSASWEYSWHSSLKVVQIKHCFKATTPFFCILNCLYCVCDSPCVQDKCP